MKQNTTTPDARLAAPPVHLHDNVLRLLGTSSTLLDCILQQASRDLGIRLEPEILDGSDAHRLGVTAPDAFDIYDQWFHNVEFIWTARSIQPVDTSRIQHWDAVCDIAKLGRVRPDQPVAPGGAPNRLLYVQDDGELGPEPSRHISMLPISHSADSFGFIASELPKELKTEEASWRWLLEPEPGSAALQDNPSVGVMDAILAVQAAGLARFDDPGNLTLEEIDLFMGELMKFRLQGHFSAFWGTPEQLAGLIGRNRVKVFSFWSPARPLIDGSPERMTVAVPREGYRGWCGGIAIARHCKGRKLDLAYQYLNWWLDGWASTPIARQGYYFSAPTRARAHMHPDEWDYWYDGKPAIRDLPSNHGSPAALAGHVLEGGNYNERMSRIAVWNAVMDEHNYLSRRWNSFINKRRN